MEITLIKLREEAEIKNTIAKQESAFWLKIAEAVGAYQKSLTKTGALQTDGKIGDNRIK